MGKSARLVGALLLAAVGLGVFAGCGNPHKRARTPQPVPGDDQPTMLG